MLACAPRVWDSLRGARVFITGGTGFFGAWLLESLLHADRELGLGARAVVLTRDAAAFRARQPRLACDGRVELLIGDVRSFAFPSGSVSHVVHAAAQVDARGDNPSQEAARAAAVDGTRRALELARRAGARAFLLASSGAVYGRQDPGTARLAEDDPGLEAPLVPPFPYAAGKRAAERLCLEASERGLRASIARGFAFVGPHLPLDAHFAVGNFVRDALGSGPIVVRGDGTPRRSYLYASDLALWLWTILLEGRPGRAYNVGSERDVSISELARLVAASVAPGCEVRIDQAPVPGRPAERYVPDTSRARSELGLREHVELREAILRTAAWARRRGS